MSESSSPKFNYAILEIASMLCVAVVGSNLRFDNKDQIPKFLLTVDNRVVVTLDSDGYQIHAELADRPNIGKWSSILEGGPSSIVETIFIRRLRKVGYDCR